MAQGEALSGLAGEIRAATTSEQFELPGYTEARARDLIISAFSAPLPGPTEMIRLTFVVGGGKLVRARYPEDLPKWLTAALREIGYTEDRSAAETLDSQGTFKQQHDTGQNLKYVVVYPRLTCGDAGNRAAGAAAGGGAAGGGAAADPRSPEAVMCAADLESFKKKAGSKLSSWRQCKRLMKVLTDHQQKIADIEAKLCAGAALSPAEQAAYDGNSGADAEKVAWLQGEIKRYVDEGQLTSSEKAELVASLEANLATLAEKKKEAQAEGKPKKLEKLEEAEKGVVARKQHVEKVSPIQLRLRYGEEVQRLRLKLLPLVALEEEKGKSMSLTMDDLKILKDKPDLEQEIAELEARSRGWFEDEADFQARCALEAKEAKAKWQAKKGGGKGGAAKSGAASSGWTNATGGAKKMGAWGSGAGSKKGMSSFAALALDE